MKRYTRPLAAVMATVILAFVVAACGSSSSSSSSSAAGGSSSSSSASTSAASGGKTGGTITIASGTAPQSADNGLDFTTQGNELESVVNTPLLTFKRGVEGAGGSKIIPGLAKSLPTLSRRGQDATRSRCARACTTPTVRRSRPPT